MPKLTLQKDELTSADVFEIMKGKLGKEHWLEDSLYITEDIFMETEMKDLLERVVPFNYYGPTEIDKAAWESIKNRAESCSALTRQARCGLWI